MHVCMYIHIYIYIYIYIIYTYIYVYTHLRTYIFLCIAHICTNTHTCTLYRERERERSFQRRSRYIEIPPRCNTLQHTAAHWNMLQHTMPHTHRSLQHRSRHSDSIATCCNTLQHILPHAATNTATRTQITATSKPLFRFYLAATHCNTLQHIATHCNTRCYTHTDHCNIEAVIQILSRPAAVALSDNCLARVYGAPHFQQCPHRTSRLNIFCSPCTHTYSYIRVPHRHT